MTLEQFLALAPESRPYGRGYRGACPACGGRSGSTKFSFSERDSKILIRCFSGCSSTDICAALGIGLKDLFVDADLTHKQREALPPKLKRADWRKFSSDMEFASESHWLRAEGIFKAAKKIDASMLDDESLDAAWECLAVGFHALRVSENLGRAACGVRVKGLLDEAQRNKRKAAA